MLSATRVEGEGDSLLSSFIIDEMWPMRVVNSRAEEIIRIAQNTNPR